MCTYNHADIKTLFAESLREKSYFTNSLLSPNLWFRAFLKKNNLRYIKFHTLRHTSATLLINQGVHAKIISERLGHGNIQVTMNTYGFALRSADKAAADKFESILKVKPRHGE
ncbi:tyrosine-type recombinase/integrase [Paenibacillus chitinolyticus]|uniref:tyrosine-type recombinase/integrase n=1 Tax=Paenibacillus chitinolyticus TaxID=79263 RepID=UPI00366A56C0